MTAALPVVAVDGVVQDPASATISVLDDGLLRGDGVFDATRVYGGRPFALDDHLARLARSAAALRLPCDVEAVRADVAAVLAAAGPVDAALRVVLTRGGARIALVQALAAQPAAMRAALVEYAPTRLLDQVKSISYGANMLADRLAAERGFDGALLVTPHGRVLEGPTWTLFYAVAGALFTPPLSDHVLASITRARLLAVTAAGERSLTRDELLSGAVSECFAASSLREVLPIAAVEDRVFAAPGPLTLAAGAAFRARVAAELAA